MFSRTPSGIAYDRAGPRGDSTLVLIHAGVADSRMWEPQWPALTAEFDVVRLDLRGFGDSTSPPVGPLSATTDVLATLDLLGVESCHLIGASLGAGIAVEVTLLRPSLVGALLLVAPGGSLIAEITPNLLSFIHAEQAALEAGDIDAAVEANLAVWFDGLTRDAADVDAKAREMVGVMQRRAFEITAGWQNIDEEELSPPALARLGEIRIPALILVGDLDLDVIQEAAALLDSKIPNSRLVSWRDVAHLPSIEEPDDFLSLVQEWVAENQKH